MAVTGDTDLAAASPQARTVVWRAVQEGLTNARKHAQDTAVSVRLSGRPGEGIAVELSNPLRVGDSRLRSPESGLGLVGLAERVDLAGGTLTHEVTPARVFVLAARLPWPALPD